jgi:glutamine synthetase
MTEASRPQGGSSTARTPGEATAKTRALREAGARVLRGTFVDSAGVLRAKQVPIDRAPVFHAAGLGASPVWVIFCADDAIAFTPNFGVVGDMRLRVDLEAAVSLGDGSAWAPTELVDQDGQALGCCPRGVLRRQQAAAEAEGQEILAATEIEFVAFDAAGGSIAGRGGPAYGLTPLVEHAAFIDDVHRDFDQAGLAIEQLHAEYGSGQIELSVAPAPPLQAADANVLARILLCRAGRRHGLRLSFSPRPLAAGVGNGAHVHLSFGRYGAAWPDGPWRLDRRRVRPVAPRGDRGPGAVAALRPATAARSLVGGVRVLGAREP